MEILFAEENLRIDCNNQELLVKRCGAELARVLRQRLDELFNAEVLGDMRSMPHISISEPPLADADLSLELGSGHRLIFRPYPLINGGLDWNKIDSILILGLTKHDA